MTTNTQIIVRLGPDRRPHFYVDDERRVFWYNAPSDDHPIPVNWDGHGMIVVYGEVLDYLVRNPQPGDGFTVLGHRLLVIRRDWASNCFWCMEDSLAAHRAYCFDLVHHSNQIAWEKLALLRHPREHWQRVFDNLVAW